MKIIGFEWDENNIAHVAYHQVSPDEVEEACYENPLVMKGRQNRYLVYSQSEAGRYLLIVLHYLGKGFMRPITARDMTLSEKKLYRKHR